MYNKLSVPVIDTIMTRKLLFTGSPSNVLVNVILAQFWNLLTLNDLLILEIRSRLKCVFALVDPVTYFIWKLGHSYHACLSSPLTVVCW